MGVTRLEVGRVSKAHGLRGEVLVIPVTNQSERFDAGGRLWLDGREVTIVTSRPSRDAFVVRFEGVADRDGAEAIRGLVLTAEPLGAAPEGEVWIHEVIGSEVRERNGTVLGRVASVEANPAHDLLVLDGGVLIPMVFVVEQTLGAVVVDLPEGLLDL